ncbi:MAG: hypothetical protein AABN34_10105 [Acidobacteriota bacterium]
MRENKHLFSGLRVVGLIVLVCLVLLGVNAWSSSAWPHKSLIVSNRQIKSFEEIAEMAKGLQPEKVPVWNMTQSFRLIKLEKVEDRDLKLTLQNGYDKKINGFQLSIGNVGIHTELMYNQDQMLPPGGIRVEQFAIQDYTDTKGIALMSVHFDDGTSDGDTVAVKQVEEERSGQKTQIKRALALIRRTLRSSDADSVAALDELLSQIRSLPSEGKNGRPDFWGGLESGKQRTVAIIEELRQKQVPSTYQAQGSHHVQSNTSIKTALMGVVERQERVASHP